MASASAAALIAGGFQIASSISSGINSYNEAKRLQAINEYNAKLVEEKKKALNYEEAMNKNLLRLNAYSEIGAGKNIMASRGNIGTSADASIITSYLNLAGDLSAMSFNYANKRFSLGTEKNNYLYQADIAKVQKGNALLGSTLSTGAAVGNTALSYYSAGGGSTRSRPVVDSNGNVLGRTGGYGVWNG